MQFFISPAKQMTVDPDSFPLTGQPVFLDRTRQLLTALRALDRTELQRLWKSSDKLTDKAMIQLLQLDLDGILTPAVMAFVGIQYRTMAPGVMTQPALDYLEANLRILSGFYGVLRAFDGVVPYRLELGSPLKTGSAPNLYQFWGNRLAESFDWSKPVLNLASKEYARAITPYLTPERTLITLTFGRLVDGKVKATGTQSKIARGAMVRYLAENQVTDLAGVQKFDAEGYRYAEELSSDNDLIYLVNYSTINDPSFWEDR